MVCWALSMVKSCFLPRAELFLYRRVVFSKFLLEKCFAKAFNSKNKEPKSALLRFLLALLDETLPSALCCKKTYVAKLN